MSDLVIVTGASSNHFSCLKNLLYSISLFESKTPTIIYDLGLTTEERKELTVAGHKLRRFRFEDYPAYFNIQIASGQYAWKPVIIADELKRTNGILLWMDAGNLIRAPLARLREQLSHAGLWSMTSSGTVAQWTHPGTLAYLRASPGMLTKPNRSAGLVAFRAGFPGIAELVESWKRGALDEACIAPPGSNRLNHRQDQAVLTVLIYQFQEKSGICLEHRRLDITAHHDSLSLDQVRELLQPAVSVMQHPS
jgi:hypothetical protein